MGGNGGHHRPAIGGVAEFKGMAERGIGRLAARHQGQALAPFGIGVVEQRLSLRPAGSSAAQEGAQVAAIARRGITRGRRGRVLTAHALGEAGGVKPHGGDIEAIEPDHRARAVIAMVMPLPIGRQHQVEGAHHRALAIDGGMGSLAFHDKAQRRLGVAMAGRHLTGQDQLQPGIEAIGDGRSTGQPRIFQDQHPPLGLLGRDHAAGAQQIVSRRGIIPAPGPRRSAGLGRHQRV